MFFPLPDIAPHIRRILGASTIQGQPGPLWLLNPAVDTVRKACLLNILAVCCVRPSSETPIIAFIDAVFAVRSERIYVLLAGTTVNFLEVACLNYRQPFYEDPESPLPVHWEMLEAVPETFVGDFTHVPLRSFRAEGAPSLQVVIADRQSNNQTIADLDLDAHNPIEDVVGFFGHMWELWTGRKVGGVTDHLVMWKTLQHTIAAPYVGYTLA